MPDTDVLLKQAQVVLSSAQTLASVAPIPHLDLLFGLASNIITTIQNTRSVHDGCESLALRVCSKLNMVASVLGERTDHTLIHDLAEVQIVLENVLYYTQTQQSRSPGSRWLTSTLDAKTVSTHKDELDRALENFGFASFLRIRQGIAALDEKLGSSHPETVIPPAHGNHLAVPQKSRHSRRPSDVAIQAEAMGRSISSPPDQPSTSQGAGGHGRWGDEGTIDRSNSSGDGGSWYSRRNAQAENDKKTENQEGRGGGGWTKNRKGKEKQNNAGYMREPLKEKEHIKENVGASKPRGEGQSKAQDAKREPEKKGGARHANSDPPPGTQDKRGKKEAKPKDKGKKKGTAKPTDPQPQPPPRSASPPTPPPETYAKTPSGITWPEPIFSAPPRFDVRAPRNVLDRPEYHALRERLSSFASSAGGESPLRGYRELWEERDKGSDYEDTTGGGKSRPGSAAGKRRHRYSDPTDSRRGGGDAPVKPGVVPDSRSQADDRLLPPAVVPEHRPPSPARDIVIVVPEY